MNVTAIAMADWDNHIVPPIFVWMLESGAADIALEEPLLHSSESGLYGDQVMQLHYSISWL
jgi:hypothetical protein